ncbi:MAG TPA: hypothetical protein VKB80_00820 [Kofleriaceae bacterium]|nr:hypothetical protein [Kofleriaceae bacterium]
MRAVRKHIVALAVVAAVGGAGAVAHAGLKSSRPTTVSKSGASGWADGILGSARNGGGAYEYLACGLQSYSTGDLFGFCYANDAAGQFAYCYTDAPTMIEAIQSVSGDSAVYFEWNGNGECTMFSMGNGSMDPPKLP